MRFAYLAGIGLAITGCIYAATSHHTSLKSIVIQGDENCRNKTEEALDLLQEKAGDYFNMVLDNVGMIKCVEKQSGMHADPVFPIYHAGSRTINAGAIWYASTIVHDACHSMLYNNYIRAHEGKVPDEAWTGKKAEIFCMLEQYKALEELGADDWTLEHMTDMINYAYWDIPYENRDW